MIGGEHDQPTPEPALTVPLGQTETYRQLATTAALLGRGLEELAQAAMMLEVPDPAALGAEGAEPNVENAGTVLRGWAGLVLGSLPQQPVGGLIVVERKLEQP